MASSALDRPHAFFSYTRKDDEFFGGQITELRKQLELGVQVVTGDRDVTIFQDVEGIELGQKWKDRINVAVNQSTLLIPIITPLFFTSEACRDELSRFIAHEQSLGRSDLIVPIYFISNPVLEDPVKSQADPLESEIKMRQMYDWRKKVELPANDPRRHAALTKLAEGIGKALARAAGGGPGFEPPSLSGQGAAAEEFSEGVERLGWEAGMTAGARQRMLILWVDDRPANNIVERGAMAAYGIDFVLATSTGQALARMREQTFDAIISDMGRPPDPRAGYTLLEAVRDSGDQTPYFIYAGSRDPEHVREAQSRGAQGCTNRGDELLAMVLRSTIFISYLHEDTDAARRLASAISNLGGDVWLDERRLLPGDDWEVDILTAIRSRVRLFIPIISANTERAGESYVFREWGEAVEQSRAIAGRGQFILPVVVDEVGDLSSYKQIPEEFRRVQAGHAPGGEPDSDLRASLAKLIRELRRAPGHAS